MAKLSCKSLESARPLETRIKSPLLRCSEYTDDTNKRLYLAVESKMPMSRRRRPSSFNPKRAVAINRVNAERKSQQTSFAYGIDADHFLPLCWQHLHEARLLMTTFGNIYVPLIG